MSMSSLQFAVLNITTIENISRKVKVWTLAVYMPDPSAMPNTSRPFRTITYPLTPAPSEPLRTFAILHSRPGDNPFDLGKYGNFKSVMGHDLLDWILPLRYSPLCDHSAQDAEFEFGPALERMKRDAGLIPPQEPPRRRRKSKRRSHRGEGSEKINPTPDTSADASLDSNEVERHDDLLGTTVDITTRTQTRRNEIEEAALDRNGNAL
jgi:palmitoyltransferase